MNDISQQKSLARAAGFAARKAAHTPDANQRAGQNLAGYLAPHHGRPLAGYMAIRTEIDPLAVMTDFAAHGPVGVPVVVGPGQQLEFHLWQPGAKMQAGAFGAQVPQNPACMVPQILIVPLVAFDQNGYRLGYGGGYYDRTLENLRKNGPVLAVGFAYGAQQMAKLPLEATDQPLNAIVTEAGVTEFAT